MWSNELAFVTAFGTLFTKVWRLYRVFFNKRMVYRVSAFTCISTHVYLMNCRSTCQTNFFSDSSSNGGTSACDINCSSCCISIDTSHSYNS